MKITIAAVGKLKESYLKEACAEYIKRLKPYCTLKINEVPEEKLLGENDADRAATVSKEGERLIAQSQKGGFVVALDARGQRVTSPDLAGLLAQKALFGQSAIVFLLGGAYGLSDKALGAADLSLSLSDLTFTHQMARLILLEQLYRAFKINAKEKYHN